MKKTVITLLLLATAFVCSEAKTRKTLFVIVDGIPADCIERLKPHTIMDIAEEGGYARAYCGGDVGMYSETPTISAIGYSNIITGTWMNKHNVRGNSNIQENYNYPTIFRIAKNQSRPVTTAIYSSWTDNRTVLLGEGKPETGNLKIDYVFDGYDNDKTNFPNKPGDFHIFDIDAHVCAEAAKNIRTNAPDLNWVYLWYTDDAFHIKGNGEHSDWSVTATDSLLSDVWEAVKYREKNNDEEWLVIIVTDHGRGNDGHNHGGQSARERTVWMATNLKKRNAQFGRPHTVAHRHTAYDMRVHGLRRARRRALRTRRHILLWQERHIRPASRPVRRQGHTVVEMRQPQGRGMDIHGHNKQQGHRRKGQLAESGRSARTGRQLYHRPQEIRRLEVLQIRRAHHEQLHNPPAAQITLRRAVRRAV